MEYSFFLDSPTDKHTRATNRAKLQLAQVLRSQKEIEYLKERYPFRMTEMPFRLPQTAGNGIDFFSYAEEYLTQYHQKDIRLVRGAFTQLRKFIYPVTEIPHGSLAAGQYHSPLLQRFFGLPATEPEREFAGKLLQEIQDVPECLRRIRANTPESGQRHPPAPVQRCNERDSL